MKKNSELRAEARAALKGNWNVSALYVFVMMLAIMIISCLSFIPFAGTVAFHVLSAPLVYAITVGFLRQLRGEELQLEWFSMGYNKRVWLTMLLKMVYIILWAFVGFVPLIVLLTAASLILDVPADLLMGLTGKVPESNIGIMCVLWVCVIFAYIPVLIKTYSYAMVEYILRDDVEIRNNAAIDKSIAMMKGHKWQLFVLDLSFIGWTFLTIITLFIGMFWVMPYQYTARAAFYEELKNA